MLKRLRLRLTLFYLLVGIGLVAAVTAISYSLLQYYFLSSTDQALRVKMGMQFIAIDSPMPVDLYNSIRNSGLVTANQVIVAASSEEATESSLEEGTERDNEVDRQRILQESELADIFVIPLNIQGQVVQSPPAGVLPISIDQAALQSALRNGSDLRTVKTSDGSPIRLLTYSVHGQGDPAFFQVGRSLKQQTDVLVNLLRGLLFLSGGIVLIIGAGAWFLSGRSIRPAQEAMEKQHTFIANASHELRAPLTLIRAGMEVADRESRDPRQKQVLEDALADADYMKRLIDDLLLLSRLDGHSLVLEKRKIQLANFLSNMSHKLKPLTADAGLSLLAESDEGYFQADPERLQQILFILTDNAIRNNHPGGWVKLNGRIEKNGVAITVSDSGKGIPQQHLEKVFDRFYKVDDGSRAARKGSGLGLSIARGLVESHHGSIQLVSEEGKGTQAIIHLPLDDEDRKADTAK